MLTFDFILDVVPSFMCGVCSKQVALMNDFVCVQCDECDMVICAECNIKWHSNAKRKNHTIRNISVQETLEQKEETTREAEEEAKEEIAGNGVSCTVKAKIICIFTCVNRA